MSRESVYKASQKTSYISCWKQGDNLSSLGDDPVPSTRENGKVIALWAETIANRD
jgi:hypothetical protein